MKLLKVTGIALIVALLLLNSYKLFLCENKDVVYVDVGRLVDNYKLKKELENQATGSLLKIKNVIDSLKLTNNIQHSRGVDSSIRRLEFEFGRYYQQSNEEITKKVWDRLNPAIEKFGKEHSYKIISGANGAGTILYGDKNYEVTDAVISFVNESYEKGD